MVDGMTCAACANRIQRKLEKLDGLSDVQVNFATGRATMMRNADVTDTQVADVIDGLGYAVIDQTDADDAGDRREADPVSYTHLRAHET